MADLSTKVLVWFTQSPIRPERFSNSQAIEAYTPFLAKEKDVGVWVFKGEENNSPEDGKNKCSVNKCLLCHTYKFSWQ